MSGKGLPILKMFLFPVVAGSAYAAYCYYSQILQARENEDVTVTYMRELNTQFQKTTKVTDVAKVYKFMAQHIKNVAVEPSLKHQKLIDKSITRGNELDSQRPFIQTKHVYYYNPSVTKTVKTSGNSTLGIWSKFTNVQIWGIKGVEPLIQISKEALNRRQLKCFNIAQTYSQNLERAFVEEYLECIGTTQKHAAQLKRNIDILEKVLKNQLIQ